MKSEFCEEQGECDNDPKLAGVGAQRSLTFPVLSTHPNGMEPKIWRGYALDQSSEQAKICPLEVQRRR
ncbi:hypothetical protein BTVI_43788 [Pitangus sulphuratus]|nr:hypothetical protein BTVI_43788 [Pitangus sulphuratus]